MVASTNHLACVAGPRTGEKFPAMQRWAEELDRLLLQMHLSDVQRTPFATLGDLVTLPNPPSPRHVLLSDRKNTPRASEGHESGGSGGRSSRPISSGRDVSADRTESRPPSDAAGVVPTTQRGGTISRDRLLKAQLDVERSLRRL